VFIHVVLMSFAPETPVTFHSDVEEFASRILRECDGLAHYLYGLNEAGRAGGFTHAVIGCFDDEAAHERYQTSAAHQEMKIFMAERIEKLVVFDSSALS